MEMLKRIFQSHSGPFFAAIVVAVGVLPGICEEFFFRGYVQTRLLARYPALLAITISALFFSIAHLDPLHVLAVFPLGFWLGMVAWKAGTIWPAVLGHTFNNSLAVLMTQFQVDPEAATVSPAMGIVFLLAMALIGTSFMISITMLVLARAPLARSTGLSVS